MAYNNNFSYYNMNSTPSEWWGSKESSKKVSTFDEGRVIDYNNQPFHSTYSSNYAQSMILPSESRNSEPAYPRHEVLQGTVTQLFASFGYINDNIIFTKSDVSGPMVKVGDKVAVEASYQPNHPMKYKGERVIKLDESRFNSSSSNTNNLSKMKPLSRDSSRLDVPVSPRPEIKFEIKRPVDRTETKKSESKRYKSLIDLSRTESVNKSRISPPRKVIQRSSPKVIQRVSPKAPLKRKSTPPTKEAKPTKKRSIEPEKSTSIRKTSTEKKDVSAKVDRIQKPVENFSLREMDCATLKYRYKDLNLPSQFFHVSLRYQRSFPLNHPMKLGNACHFKVFDKKVKCIDKYVNDQLQRDVDPADADYSFVAKVMLMSMDDLAEFYKQTLNMAEEFDGATKLPITKAIKFLIGSRGEKKEFAFGGAWSPSLDGDDPENNPRVLINTAIRTVKSLTGIDLSGCSSWPKFLEFHYYRPMEKIQKKGGVQDKPTESESSEEVVEYREPRMDTIVYYIPDIWNCVPSQDSWNGICKLYNDQLTSILCPPPEIPIGAINHSSLNQQINSPTERKDDRKSAEDGQEEEDYNFSENDDSDNKSKDPEPLVEEVKPTHFSKLTIDTMKIVEIRKELELRNLSVKGVMAQLKARLKSALEKEEIDEKNRAVEAVAVVVVPVIEQKSEPSTVLSEAEKTELKKLYELPANPHVFVHQNQKIYDNQMKIKIMSLHSMLSYYNMKLKESTFEIAVFAKQFLEMLRRDAVFNIYKSLVVTPEADFVVKDESDSKKPKLMVTTSKRTINRQLLFSCTVLDRERLNKISVEELRSQTEGLGTCLSTSQLSAVIDKIKDPQVFRYRQLTDKEVSDDEIKRLFSVDQTEDLDYIRELSVGNKALFESEEIAVDNLSVDTEEVERLKNELDKSERCRQTLELKVSEMREETEKSINVMQSQIVEIQKLKETISDYRKKYHDERDRGDFYKRDSEKMMRELKEIERSASHHNKVVTDILEKHKKVEKKNDQQQLSAKDKKDQDDKQTTTSEITKSKDGVTSNKDKSVSVSDENNMMEGVVTIDLEAVNDVVTVSEDVPNGPSTDQINLEDHEKEIVDVMETEEKVNGDDLSSNHHSTVDFELSRPDYDIIILDETE